MKLLISPIDADEARAAVEGGAEIIDIKNPSEGSLGASFPWVVKEIKDSIPTDVEVSATLGDMNNRPGFASLVAYGLSTLNVDYIKAGLFVVKRKEAEKLGASIVKAAGDTGCKVVLAGYGDHKNTRSINPLEIPEIARAAGADGVMIDTHSKNGSTLFEHMPVEELERFIAEARKYGLTVALAGSLQTRHIPELKHLNPDIVGVRGAVCQNKDRLNGRIETEKVKEFKTRLTEEGRVV